MEQESNISQDENRATRMMREIFESGRTLTYVRTAEEQRVARVLRDAGRRLEPTAPIPVWTWTLTEGMRREDGSSPEGVESARAALDFIARHQESAIFHLRDFHEPLREDPIVRRRLRDLYEVCMDRSKYVVISSPIRFVPEEVERDMVYLELRLPDLLEINDFLLDEAQKLAARGVPADTRPETLYAMSRALQGLTLNEARHAVRRALAGGGFGLESMPALLEEKRLLVNRSGVIEFIDSGTDISQVGGLEILKEWLVERRKLFALGDKLNAEIAPKGTLIMGIPGCGKSLCVKAISRHFELPLYRIDMIEVFSGRHGQPEGAFVQACKTLEEMAPAVVWFDEIEMGITSAESSGEQGRIFAFFLTWMQEKVRGLFIAATANRIDLLPAEMIRKGRFDEVFFVDLPTDEERIAIFKIHFARRDVDAGSFNLERLATFTNGWTGAEIEQCVVSAMTRARLEDREVTEADLVNVASGVVPLSRTMKEQISQIRGWASERAMRASARQVPR
jgi:hypothetical protein